ncbi:amidohydrolase family protein [Fusibacter ferrireducens]|uniref:Amidohydrolase family protein n=1 Tax=Fusibacter ferrireducens TaxID=2785058 RepID=A0ABR9ZQZ9_9FIRM|nr:amidohydrolase family protein [Fusibacter ferrireducens]MBF4692074.1 amidohydrolase family protein [Fusibacter ferrireducens]
MIIDGHSHVTLPVEAHIKAMDKSGVDKTVLFSTSFHPEVAEDAQGVKEAMYFLNDLLAGKKGSMVEIREKANAELVMAIEQHPSRYIGFGGVPAGLDLETTKQFIHDNVKKHNLAGMGEFTFGTGQVHLMENVFKSTLEFNNMPIWIHAFFPLNMQDIKAIAELAKQYPRTPVILGHLGGSNWLDTLALAKEIPNLYLDTSAYYSTFVLGIVINELPQKCIFGVDRPFGDIQLSLDALRSVAKTPDVAKAVLGENMAKLLKL